VGAFDYAVDLWRAGGSAGATGPPLAPRNAPVLALAQGRLRT